MFTGIVETIGTIVKAEAGADGRRLIVDAAGAAGAGWRLDAGDSVAIAGVCQTVVEHDASRFAVDAIGTTLSRTTLGSLAAGDEVNLERALAFGDRLGGHLVQGHVDAVGLVRAVERVADHVLLDVQVPDEVAEVTVPHGSIAIDGVSLTVNAIPAPDLVQVALIPYTWEHTTLKRLRPGARVNLESDMIGKFVVHHLRRREGSGVS